MEMYDIVKLHHEEAIRIGAKDNSFDVAFTFLIGSQNYGLDVETSDVDTISIAIPTISFLATNCSNAINKTIESNHGLIKIRDFRSFLLNDLAKGNVTTLEFFYTKCLFSGRAYDDIIDKLFKHSKEVMYGNIAGTLRSTVGYFEQCKSRLYKQDHKGYNVELKYNPKMAMHIYRVFFWIRDYLDIKNVNTNIFEANCITRQILRNIRSGNRPLDLLEKDIQDMENTIYTMPVKDIAKDMLQYNNSILYKIAEELLRRSING